MGPIHLSWIAVAKVIIFLRIKNIFQKSWNVFLFLLKIKLLNTSKKIYFASDVHLGLPNYEDSLIREKKFVKWLDLIKKDAEEIYLLGDIFDFWHEYKYVAPSGYVRFLGKLAEITDSGIPVHYFTGNHDIWIYNYLPKETGIILHRKPITKILNNKKFYLAHGDGLGPWDKGFKLMKAGFTNPVLQWFFARLHPNFAITIANTLSRKKRYAQEDKELIFKGEDKEWLILYSKMLLEKEHFDFLIYGHRHIPYETKINNSKYINLGDWIYNFTYAEFDGTEVKLLKFE